MTLETEKPDSEGVPGKEKFFTAPLAVIFLVVFIDLVGFGMIIPILPLYAEYSPFLATPFEIGLLLSVYSWMQFFFSPLLGRLSDRHGRRPILFLSLIGSAAGYMIIGLAGSLAMVFIGRIVSGITGANISAAQAYVADVTTRENRAKGMGLFGAAFGLGFVMGPAIAGVLSKFSIQLPFFFAAGFSLTSAGAVYFFLPESLVRKTGNGEPGATDNARSFLDRFADRTFALINVSYFFLVTAFSIMTYAFVLFTSFRYGYTAEQNGYLFAFVGIVAIIGQGFLFARLARRFGETRLTPIGCLAMAISLYVLPMIGPDSGGLLALLGVCILLSLGNALASPSLTSLVSKVSSDEDQGTSLGIVQSGASLARAVGPMIGGVLLNNAFDRVDEMTIYRTFWTASGIMMIALGASLFLRRRAERDA
ncbi:MAG: MFS transporter [Chloracidobacterium sp.]|nr:MFS transporter [Chloracidobacterium sp.]